MTANVHDGCRIDNANERYRGENPAALVNLPLMPIVEVESWDDPRLGPYRNLKDKEIARHDRRFIAEGEQVVRRLLASKLAVESVLLARRKLPAMGPLVPPDVTAWVADDEVVHGIIGFEFHSGVMACGFRP